MVYNYDFGHNCILIVPLLIWQYDPIKISRLVRIFQIYRIEMM